DQAEREQQREHPRPERDDEEDRDEDQWESPEDVDHGADRGVDLAAVVTGGEAEEAAEEERDGGDHEADEDGEANSVQDAAEGVAPELVRAEQMPLREGRLQRVEQVLLRVVVRRDPGGKGPERHEQGPY